MSHSTTTGELTPIERGLRSGLHDFLNRAFFQVSPHRWVMAGSGKFDLHHHILIFGDLAPEHFQFQVCDGHLAVRVFDEVLLIGVSQLTEASWASVYTTYQAAHEAGLRELAACAALALDGLESKGAADVRALH